MVTSAIVPVILLLALGAVLRRYFVTDAEFWRGLEWLTYYVFTPALFVESIADTELTGVAVGPLLISLTVPVVVVTAALVALRRLLRADGPLLTSLVQGSIRMNTYIGLVFASALNGSEGIASFALTAAVMVPLVNVVSVTALSVYGLTSQDRKPLWRELIGNPLILGCVVGLALNLTGIGLPEPVAVPLELLASPALVCGTLVAGAAISVRVRKRDAIDLTLASVVKLIVLPVATATIASALGVSGVLLVSIVIASALPTASSAYILASRMGGDTRVMASISGVQTVLSTATLPLMLSLLT